MGYGRGADPEQDVEPALISADFLIFNHCSCISSEVVGKIELSPSSVESHRIFCPSEQGERTLGGLGRNPITKSMEDFKTSVFKVVVISSVVLDQIKICLLKAAKRDQDGETGQVLSRQISLVLCWRPRDVARTL